MTENVYPFVITAPEIVTDYIITKIDGLDTSFLSYKTGNVSALQSKQYFQRVPEKREVTIYMRVKSSRDCYTLTKLFYKTPNIIMEDMATHAELEMKFISAEWNAWENGMVYKLQAFAAPLWRVWERHPLFAEQDAAYGDLNLIADGNMKFELFTAPGKVFSFVRLGATSRDRTNNVVSRMKFEFTVDESFGFKHFIFDTQDIPSSGFYDDQGRKSFGKVRMTVGSSPFLGADGTRYGIGYTGPILDKKRSHVLIEKENFF